MRGIQGLYGRRTLHQGHGGLQLPAAREDHVRLYQPMHHAARVWRRPAVPKSVPEQRRLSAQAGVHLGDTGIWLVSFMDYDLGYIDLEEKTLQPLPNPFGPKVLPVS